MHTSLRHYSLTVERDAAAGRPRRVDPVVEAAKPRPAKPRLRDRINAMMRPGRSPVAGAHA
jgi:hypothetical protein